MLAAHNLLFCFMFDGMQISFFSLSAIEALGNGFL